MADQRLINEDLAPVPPDKRTWSQWNIAALWVGMAVCIPSYMLAASLMKAGMSWWQALLTIALGNVIVLVPMVLNGHGGTKYGIPFPVLLRASFGVFGSNIPALMRAFVACGWFGIQTWIGGAAMYALAAVIFGFKAAGPGDALPVVGISFGQLLCFLLFWGIHIAIIMRGVESIKWLESYAAPFLIALGIAMLLWGLIKAGGFGAIFSDEVSAKVRAGVKDYSFWKVFFPSLTAMVGFWATLALNIPDFTRFARSQRDQIVGQAISLPSTMTLFSFIGITVTSATVVVFGEAIWDPVKLLAKFKSPIIVVVSMLGLMLATLSTNLAANVVSPANDFANVNPRRITFRTGALITGVIGIVIMPWRLISDLGAYIFTWLIGYGALLGAVGGIMLTDYYLIRKTELVADDLYKRDGAYSYGGSGFNWRALVAFALGVAPNVLGFLTVASNGSFHAPGYLVGLRAETGAHVDQLGLFVGLYQYAWFVGLFVAAGSYYALMKLSPPPEPRDRGS